MKIQLNQPILNFNDEPIKSEGKELTYGQMLRNLLGAPFEKDSGDKKLKKFNIGMKCVADEVELNIDERKIIKDLADEMGLNPIIYGRICQLLENE